jgi:hypothetical protein
MADAKAAASTQVTLKNLRLGFPFLFVRGQPQKRDDGTMSEGNFRASGIMYRTPEFIKDTNANLALIKGAKEVALTAKYGSDQSKWPKYKPEKLCVRDGNLESWDGFQNSWYIAASENEQPLLLSRRRDPDNAKLWLPATRTELYAGCYVNMIVQIWIQDNAQGKRVNANLKAVQFLRKGDSFAGSAPIAPDQAFTDVEEEEDGGDIGDENSFSAPDDDADDVI